MDTRPLPKDSPAWLLFTWISFIVSAGMTFLGIVYLPTDLWVKGFFTMAFLFVVGSTFTLSKTVRDNYEAQRQPSRIIEARSDRMLHEYDAKHAA